MSGIFEDVSTVEGVVKVYSQGNFGREHTCSFSLGRVKKTPYFLLKGKAVIPKKVKVRGVTPPANPQIA